MSSNPWGNITLKRTGLTNMRLSQENENKQKMEESQEQFQKQAIENESKTNIYKERIESLGADAMLGQQGRLGGQKLKKNKSRKSRVKTKKMKKMKKTKRNRSYK